MQKGSIVKHKLNRMKMIVRNIDDLNNVLCAWYDDRDRVWKSEVFASAELEIIEKKERGVQSKND